MNRSENSTEVQDFTGKELKYQHWLVENPGGFVLSTITKNPSRFMFLHRSTCRSISKYRKNMGKNAFTGGTYTKICSMERAELEEWARKRGRDGFSGVCRLCNPQV